VRDRLGRVAFDVEFAAGAALTQAEAVDYALGRTSPPPQTPTTPGPDILTKRERDVAALVAAGRSNKDIAAELVISVRTAETHVEHILAKLGFTSRTQIAAWMADQHPARRD
jgi:DNA-binding NarL/FixJ family response regulator